ncbi:MAG: hypothetical protein Q9163_004543 [Psora crenata]
MASDSVKVPAVAEPPPISKNQQKKLKRDQEWEANRAARKAKRKEKVKEKKLQKRAAHKVDSVGIPPAQRILSPNVHASSKNHSAEVPRPRHRRFVQLPITFVLDCSFDDLMNEKERISLASQITRCYSDNHRAPYQAHLAISSFGGHLKERFEGVLSGSYQSWRNVRFLEGDFVETAQQANTWMKDSQGGRLAGIFEGFDAPRSSTSGGDPEGEVIYLSSDSPNTLTELRPYSTYVIGGLVDRNRHKGVCYKRAIERGVKTARLPISDYMQMTSRFVLATNHVAEIMVRWLEVGDWGKAFQQVIPKRKGGTLKDAPTEAPDDQKPSERGGNDGDEATGEIPNGTSCVEEHDDFAEDAEGDPSTGGGVSESQPTSGDLQPPERQLSGLTDSPPRQ